MWRGGQTLLTIESPDLIQAESGLIAAAGVWDLTSHALTRAQQLYEVQGIAEKDLQQAVSDQQTAEGALKAAHDGVAVFGKSEAEIDRMVKTRTIDPTSWCRARFPAGLPRAPRRRETSCSRATCRLPTPWRIFHESG